MVFDTMCQMVEKWWPKLAPIVEHAVVCRFPINAHAVLPKQYDHSYKEYEHQFRLPYPVTAIEDNASCMVLMDTEPFQEGLHGERHFIECIPMEDKPSAFNMTFEEKLRLMEISSDAPLGLVTMTAGAFHVVECHSNKNALWGSLSHMLVGTPDVLYSSPHVLNEAPREVVEIALGDAISNAMTAIEELIYLQSRPNFREWPHPQSDGFHPLTSLLKRPLFDFEEDGMLL